MLKIKEKCQENDYYFTNFESSKSEELNKQYCTVLDFGRVVTGKKFQKIFRIKNDTKVPLAYYIKRDPDVNPIYQVFDFNIYEATVQPNEYLQIKVTFQSITPHSKYVDNFQILDGNKNLYRICLKGECRGPRMLYSVKCINFFITSKEVVKKHIFEIKNISEVPAQYQFDINEKETVFRIDKIRGILGPKQHAFITVWFEPKENRCYSAILTCLILHQEPMIIHLYGFCNSKCDQPTCEFGFLKYPQDKEDANGYFAYMSDCVEVRELPPAVSLSETYLDFGRISLETDENSRTLTTCLTNHMGVLIEVTWDNSSDIFKITPQRIKLPSKESVLYEVTFRPNISDNFFSKIMTAQIYWRDSRSSVKESIEVKYIEVPLTITLRLLGDSFPEKERWIPNVEINPQVVVLPPTIPNYPVYGTFILASSGYLPASFKFIPPQKTNFILKPMIGVITGYQIVVVQLQPDGDENKAYVEYWEVQLNGRTENCNPFYIKCYSSLPSVVVGVNNQVTFDSVHEGCRKTVQVAIKNTSVHYLEYTFFISDLPFLCIDYPTGTLAANETVYIPWNIEALISLPIDIKVRCELYGVQNMKTVFGNEIIVYVKVNVSVTFGKLCAMPNSYDCQDIQWGSSQTITFHAFNFGEAPIHYKMICFENDKVLFNNELIITPEQNTVLPKSHNEIILHLTGILTGKHTLQILYKIRKHELSHEAINENPESIFTLTYNCLYPTIQILDINFHTYAPNFSKVRLWKLLSIDQVNTALKTIQHGETDIVESILPDYEESPSTFEVIMTLKNTTKFKTEVKFQRKKVCDCPCVEISKGISFRANVYDCKHRDMFSIVTPERYFEGLSTDKIKFLIRYTEPGSNISVYKIILCNDRILEWHISINITSIGATVPSKYNRYYEMNMKKIPLKCKHPQIQSFKFYNDSSSIVTYTLDITKLNQLETEQNYPILSCVNPKNNLLPLKSSHLMFKFSPLQCSRLQISLPLMLGDKPVDLVVKGSGYKYPYTFTSEPKCDIPVLPYSSNTDATIILSTDEIVINKMLVWSTCERLIFIRNLSKNRVIGYSWETCDIQGILSIKTVARKGVLQPKESHAVIIQMRSFDEPFDITCILPCKLLDHTQYYEHMKSMDDYRNKQEELQGQFTITEKSIVYPQNDVVVIPKPELYYISLEVSVNCFSIIDRDLFLSIPAQMHQSPQYLLKPNLTRLLSYFPFLKHPNEVPITSFAIEKMKKDKLKKFERALQFDLHPHEFSRTHHIKTYKHIAECIISDLVFSNIFHDIIIKREKLKAPFYEQYRIEDDELYHWGKNTSQVFGKSFLDIYDDMNNLKIEYRKFSIEKFAKKPQPPLCAEILANVINESVHEVFRLGAQIKDVEKRTSPDVQSRHLLKYACECAEEIYENK